MDKQVPWKNLLKYASGWRNSSYEFQESPEHSWVKRRILNDLKEIQNDNMLFMEADVHEDSIFQWDITFLAPNGNTIKATLHFGSEYPFIPPRMFMKQRIFHPNISLRGEVCLKDLENIWTPAHSTWSLILSVQSLLSDPNPSDPINAIAADMLLKTPEAYHKYSLECYEMLDFFNDEVDDCEIKDEDKIVELKDSKELHDEASFQNGKNNFLEKVEMEDSLRVELESNNEANSRNHENNSFVKIESEELNDESVFELEEEMLIQHILQNTFLN